MSSKEGVIGSRKLLGHRGSVLCMDVSDDEHLLLSGSEDKTARLWDLREQKLRACLCIPTKHEVQSVAFRPTAPMAPNEADADTASDVGMDGESSSASSFAKEHSVYLGMDRFVYEFDLRKATGPLLTEPIRDMSSILHNQDEVNQISLRHFHHKATKRKGGKGSGQKKRANQNQNQNQTKLYMATCDDAGTIRVMDAASTRSDVLHHDANAVVVIPTCAFRRGPQKSLELASGGTDCNIRLWDATKPKKPISTFLVKQAVDAEQDGSSTVTRPQVANPPFVYSLDWSESGKLLAAGYGNGDAGVFCVESGSLVQVGLLEGGHASSVASVMFPRFARGNERVVVTAGTDSTILIWDVGMGVVGVESNYNNPRNLFSQSFLSNQGMAMQTGSAISTPAAATDEITRDLQSMMSDKPQVLFGINHTAKVNWVCSTRHPAALFVADTSNDITCYDIPSAQ